MMTDESDQASQIEKVLDRPFAFNNNSNYRKTL
jgi:hypothetical protein